MTQKKHITYLVRGDTAPDLRVRFLGLDLTDYDSISINVERDDGARFSRPVVVDANDHECGLVAWEVGDLVTGDHEAEFEFFQGAKRSTLPNKAPVELRVRRDLR
jgi:hypothetical protein